MTDCALTDHIIMVSAQSTYPIFIFNWPKIKLAKWHENRLLNTACLLTYRPSHSECLDTFFSAQGKRNGLRGVSGSCRSQGYTPKNQQRKTTGQKQEDCWGNSIGAVWCSHGSGVVVKKRHLEMSPLRSSLGGGK